MPLPIAAIPLGNRGAIQVDATGMANICDKKKREMDPL
jgi:hypothetical protein